MTNNKLTFWAIVDSLGIFVYVSLVAIVLFNGEVIFGKMNNVTGPMMFLLLFLVSAVITGGLFLGRPIWLYFEGFKKEAVQLFLATLLFLVILTTIVFIFVMSV